jgi:parallel beta-helix repeat protein
MKSNARGNYAMKWMLPIVSLCLLSLVVTSAESASNPHSMTIVQYTIKHNNTGGDCTLFGTWDNPSGTCTLTSDIIAGPINYNVQDVILSIEGNGITLNGNGHAIIDNHPQAGKTGVYISRQNRVTIQNLAITNCAYGIFLENGATKNVVKNSVITGNSWSVSGIALVQSSDNIITANNISYGNVTLTHNSDNNVLTGNTVIPYYGATSFYLTNESSNNIISNNIIRYRIEQDSTCVNNIVNDNIFR